MWPDRVHCEEAGGDDTGKVIKFWTMMRGEADKNDQVQQIQGSAVFDVQKEFSVKIFNQCFPGILFQ